MVDSPNNQASNQPSDRLVASGPQRTGISRPRES